MSCSSSCVRRVCQSSKDPSRTRTASLRGSWTRTKTRSSCGNREAAPAGAVMAVWQVEFAIVPRRALAAKPKVGATQIIDTDWWNTERLPPGYSQQLAAIVPLGSSWATELQTWGDQ